MHAPGVSGPNGGVSAAQVEAEVAGGGDGEEEPPIILDDIFRKTDAKPSLYWLPLSEEEVSQAEWGRFRPKRSGTCFGLFAQSALLCPLEDVME